MELGVGPRISDSKSCMLSSHSVPWSCVTAPFLLTGHMGRAAMLGTAHFSVFVTGPTVCEGHKRLSIPASFNGPRGSAVPELT